MSQIRTHLQGSDPETVRTLARETRFFSDEEVDIAHELAVEALTKGESSGYHFVFVEQNSDVNGVGFVRGYACYGPIPGTRASYDLYWIVVAKEHQGAGVGQALLANVESLIRARGGTRLYADTSTRPQYEPTRAFYQRCGFSQAAVLDDFYTEGDGKVIYVKRLAPEEVSGSER